VTFIEQNTVDLVSLAVGVLLFLVLMAIYNATLVKDPMKGRVKALMERRDELKSGLVAQTKRRSPIKKIDSVSIIKKIGERLNVQRFKQSDKIALHLVQAGYRSKDAIIIYQVLRVILPVVIGGIATIYIYGLNLLADKPMIQPLAAVAAFFVGYKLPDIMIANKKQKRSDSVRKALPDALDLLVVCAEAGLTLDAALKRVAKEFAGASPELAEELQLASIELSFLPERRQALINLSQRVDLPSLRNVVTTLIQSEKYGTPLATSLRVLSAEFRNERLLLAEEKAAKLPAILTVPLILFILPVLFIVLMGPATCKLKSFVDS